MSTTLLTLIGRFEQDKNVAKREVEYCESSLNLTSFSGGTVNGKMLQLSIAQADGNMAYVQLTRDQVKEMIANLEEEFD